VPCAFVFDGSTRLLVEILQAPLDCCTESDILSPPSNGKRRLMVRGAAILSVCYPIPLSPPGSLAADPHGIDSVRNRDQHARRGVLEQNHTGRTSVDVTGRESFLDQQRWISSARSAQPAALARARTSWCPLK
jgi:hypothetical protein